MDPNYNNLIKNIYIKTIIEACMESCDKEKIILVQGNGKQFSTRSQIHTLITLPYGTGKSTLARQIPNSFYCSDFTEPGLIGSIDNGEFIEGAIFNAFGKVLIIDEGQRFSQAAIEAMKNLMETQHHSRSLGRKVEFKKTSTKKFSYFRTNPTKNGWSIGGRFSALTFAEYVSKQMGRAWTSRNLCASMTLNQSDAYGVIKGEPLMEINTSFLQKDEDILKTQQEEPMIFNNYIEYVNAHEDMFNKLNIQIKEDEWGYVTRNILDLARLACHFGRVDNYRGSDLSKKYWQFALRFMPISLYFARVSTLPQRHMQVVEMVNFTELNQTEIASSLKMDKGNLSKLISILNDKKLLLREI